MNLENVGIKILNPSWDSVLASVPVSVWNSVWNSVYNSVWNSVNIGLQDPIKKERRQG